ncbi:MAG TPA: c-type cytochrome [Steroidobacteraceae bacterium]|nr:c-type cytochrome [Steroidobacteraceae bacterium]
MLRWVRSGVVSLALICTALGSAAACAQTAAPAGNAAHGKAISYTCLGCHGIKGYRNAYPNYSVPKLEGQHPEYIVAALQAYRSGDRSQMTMHSQASSLSDQDMADIAAFFAGTPLQAHPATAGASASTVPAAAAVCVACHGTDGVGIVAQYPTLSGQHQDYLARALADYKSGARKNLVMAGMVTTLKDADIEVVAAYYAGLKPSLETLERPYTILSVGR